LKKGNVSEHWYHGGTAAPTHDEEEASDASKKTRPRYHLWVRAAVHKLISKSLSIMLQQAAYLQAGPD
jgi:hypothetical protein